jgi:ERCC4-type nuclease
VVTTKTIRSEPITIVVDSREQRPYRFEGAVTKTLPTADYSVLGLEDRVAIERKSKSDAFNSLGRNRGRFEREIQRLALLQFGAIVIEASLADFLRSPAFSQMSGRAAARSLLAWSVRYRLPVIWAGDRRHARAVTRYLLESFARYHREGRHPGWLMVPTLAESAAGR